MTINTKIRLTLFASAFALAVPAAFAQGSGTWYQGIHTDAGGAADAPAGRHSQQIMQKQVAPLAVAPDTGTWFQGIHTDPGASADAPAARHAESVMQKKVSGSALPALDRPLVPAY